MSKHVASRPLKKRLIRDGERGRGYGGGGRGRLYIPIATLSPPE